MCFRRALLAAIGAEPGNVELWQLKASLVDQHEDIVGRIWVPHRPLTIGAAEEKLDQVRRLLGDRARLFDNPPTAQLPAQASSTCTCSAWTTPPPTPDSYARAISGTTARPLHDEPSTAPASPPQASRPECGLVAVSSARQRSPAQRSLCRTGNTQRKRLRPGFLHQQSSWHSHLIAPRRSCAWPISAAPT